MEMFSIASGSSGNCICVGNDNDHVLIDCGISGKKTEAGLNQYELTTPDCAGILVTHEHIDHIAGLGVIMRRYGLKVYATLGTIRAILKDRRVGKVDESLFNVIHPDEEFQIGTLDVKPIHISHDAADPVGYILRDDDSGRKVAVVTDLGTYDDYTIGNLQGLSAVLLEANHDENMLSCGPYPYPLKRRIKSDYGHLSNSLSGQLLGHILNDSIEHVFLGHLSAENNYAPLAVETVNQEITDGDNPYKAKDFNITVASRHEVSEKVVV